MKQYYSMSVKNKLSSIKKDRINLSIRPHASSRSWVEHCISIYFYNYG